VNRVLKEKGILLETWTIMDATIIDAPTSTKNKEWKRDPEMHSTKKWNQWYFGMKAHIWTDTNGLVHSAEFTSANVHDSQVADKLLHWKEKEEYWDSAYYSKKRLLNSLLRWCLFNVCIKRTRGQELTAYEKLTNRIFSSIRARVEHVFHTVKHLWWHHKTRYRWLMKNWSQRFALLMLQNMYKIRKMKISWY
jgi:IS5 family transposase